MADYFVFLANNPPAAGMVFVILMVVVFGMLIRFMAGSQDHDRIRSHLQERGYEPLDVVWEPFGRGWWGEKNDRIYSVCYRDPEGNEHQAWCKTSIWGGVFLSEDAPAVSKRRPMQGPIDIGPDDPVEQLRKENEKLRQELERLKRDRGGSADKDLR